MLNFGDVFRHRDGYYIYLLQTGEIFFAAKVCDHENTKNLKRLSDLRSRRADNHADEDPTFCFVVLTTDEFKDQAAHYGRPNVDIDIPMEFVCHLNETDLEVLKKEIKSDNAANQFLRKTIQELFPD